MRRTSGDRCIRDQERPRDDLGEADRGPSGTGTTAGDRRSKGQRAKEAGTTRRRFPRG